MNPEDFITRVLTIVTVVIKRRRQLKRHIRFLASNYNCKSCAGMSFKNMGTI